MERSAGQQEARLRDSAYLAASLIFPHFKYLEILSLPRLRRHFSYLAWVGIRRTGFAYCELTDLSHAKDAKAS